MSGTVPLSDMVNLGCPGCEDIVETDQIGTSPHIETGEPVPQFECKQCGGVYDITEFFAETTLPGGNPDS